MKVQEICFCSLDEFLSHIKFENKKAAVFIVQGHATISHTKKKGVEYQSDAYVILKQKQTNNLYYLKKQQPDVICFGDVCIFEERKEGGVVMHVFATRNASYRFSARAAYILNGEGVSISMIGWSKTLVYIIDKHPVLVACDGRTIS